MNFVKRLFNLLIGQSFRLYLGGGGSGQQVNSTTNTSNIPEYARPYVENMLGATQNQLFNTRQVAGTDDTPGYTELTGFKPYQPYSTNPENYVAGFSPLQQQGFSSLANMQVAPQIGQGTGIANQASQGAMGTAAPAMGLGAQGFGIGQQGMQAGMAYGQNATNPNAVAAYMNPYIQNTLNPALQLMNQQYGMQGAQEQGAATSAGAFGGSRNALMGGLNQQNRMLAGNQLVGNAYNQAYNTANQNMQQASALGMQGAQTGLAGVNAGLQGVQGAQAGYGLGLQGANTLGNLANTQYNQEMGIAQAQLGAGAQQQNRQQQIINQGVQDYANSQQYPLMQLGTMSNMLRGLPMQSSTTNQYMAAPNPVTQGVGAAGSLAYMNSAMQPKTAAKGGIMQAFDVGGEVRANLENMSLQQLQQYMNQSSSPEVKRMAQELIRQKTMEQQFQEQQHQPVSQQYAKGGITEVQRFQSKGEVESDPLVDTAKIDKTSDLLRALGFMDKAGNPVNAGRITPEVTAAPRSAPAPVAPPAGNFARVTTPNTLYGLSGVGSTGLSPRASVMPTIDAGTGEVVNTAVEPGQSINPRFNPIPETKLPTIPTIAAPSGVEEAPAPAGNGIMQAGTSASDKKLLGEAPRQYRDRDEAMAELLAEKEKYGLSDNTAAQDYRRKAMAERANQSDEATRQRQLRAAEYFANLGTKPGGVILAALQAGKEAIPNLINDDREQAKARKEMDRMIFDIDQSIRAEKLGDFAEAGKIKEKAMDRFEKWNEKLLMLQMGREANASRVAAANVGALNKQERDAMQQSKQDQVIYQNSIANYQKQITTLKDEYYKNNPTYVAAEQALAGGTLKDPEKIKTYTDIVNAGRQHLATQLQPYVNSIIRTGREIGVEHKPEEYLYHFGKPSNVASNNGFRIVSQE